MISFYPGPSKVWEALPRYLQEAASSGILSVNHRSTAFEQLWQDLVNELHRKLEIPENYTILPASSATECWEILAQSLLGARGKSLHLYNGAFGEKWQEYTQRLTGAADGLPFAIDALPDLQRIPANKYRLLALTHNETSNGTALPDSFMHALRRQHPHLLIAADATSSMAAVSLPWAAADVWFASVQKGFGLPAGLALLICSPQAVAAAEQIGEHHHYNSLPFMLQNARKGQTTHTPNVLGLYLLWRSLQDRTYQSALTDVIKKRGQQWQQFWSDCSCFNLLVANKELQSPTVITVEGAVDAIATLKKDAFAAGYYLGNGYGSWKENTFRIANFPAHAQAEIEKLQEFLHKWCSSHK